MRIVTIMPVQEKDPLTPVELWPWPCIQDGLSPHDRSRSYLISRALIEYPEAQAFLWVDDDSEAEEKDAQRLIQTMEETDADLVTGVYVCRHAASRGALALNFNAKPEPKARTRDLLFYEHGGPYPITACGFGFVLTHRRMFEREDAPEAGYVSKGGLFYAGRAYFLPMVIDRQHLGEDRSFCSRNQGAHMLVDTRACIGHAGHTLRDVIEKQGG